MELNPARPILLVDDEPDFLRMARLILKSRGFNNVVTCPQSAAAMNLLEKNTFSVIVLDLVMPDFDGMQLLFKAAITQPSTPVVMVTAVNDTASAVDCIKCGASDYITKPIDEIRFFYSIQNALISFYRQEEGIRLKNAIVNTALEHSATFEQLVTQSEAMHGIFRYVEAIAESPHAVLLIGETGTGKELFARAIHAAGGCRGNFVPVNIAGVDAGLFSDTLFGHSAGAFTGAVQKRTGLIEQAAGGTLFLDEIGDLESEGQVKLLRLLQERTYYPIGSDAPKISSARIIAATNRDLESLQKKGAFRPDLYFRLKTHEIRLPPLRERTEDVPLLVDHFIEKSCRMLGKESITYPMQLHSLLMTYHFPGNVRELESIILDAVTRHKSGILSLDSVKKAIGREICMARETARESPENFSGAGWFSQTTPLPSFKDVEYALIQEALKRTQGNVSQAATILGLTRQALTNRISRHLDRCFS